MPDEHVKLLQFGEEERRRVARELHDDVGQRFALLADDLDSLRRELILTDDSYQPRLDRLVFQAHALSEDLRRISHVLHPSIVEELGLPVALRSLVADVEERTGIPITFHHGAVPGALRKDLATALYRIAQEALRNASRYSADGIIELDLDADADELVLVIADTGAGFDPDAQTGLGLISMRERAELAGATFTLNSAPGKGTTITVRLPL